MKDPQPLIDDYLHDALDDTGRAELRTWLKEDDSHLRRFTEALMFDEEIRAAVHAKEGADSAGRFSGAVTSLPQPTPSTIPSRSTPATPHHLARAAAWLGAFTWLGNKAQAAGAVSTTTTTLLMTKTTTTAITVAILLAGGGSLYLIHQSNEQAAARVDLLETRQAAGYDATAERRSSRQVTSSITTSNAQPAAETHAKLLSDLNGYFKYRDYDHDRKYRHPEFKEKIALLDVQDVKALLLQAEQMKDPHPELLGFILESLLEKSPVDATLFAIGHLTHASRFNSKVAETFGAAFEAWRKADPAAADKWYTAALASGELTPKCIPGKDEAHLLPERVLARSRLRDLLNTDSDQAEIMYQSMEPIDAIRVLAVSNSDEHIAKFAPQLNPTQQYQLIFERVFVLAPEGFTQTADWLNTLSIAESARGELMAIAARTSYRAGKLSRAEALEVVNSLPATPRREQARMIIEGN